MEVEAAEDHRGQRSNEDVRIGGDMAKGRMLLRRISMSDSLNDLSCDTARLLYTWMLAHLDCNGCYYGDPVKVKNTIFPLREDVTKHKIESYLDEMANLQPTPLIVRYKVNGRVYIIYPDFEDRQPKINKDREGVSDIPEPSEEIKNICKSIVKEKSGATHEQLMSKSGVTPAEYNIKEGNAQNEIDADLFFNCTYFTVTRKDATKYCLAYKLSEDELMVELRKIEIWNDANPQKRKKNYDRHITNWLGNRKPSLQKVQGSDRERGKQSIKQLHEQARVRAAELRAINGGNKEGCDAGHIAASPPGNQRSEKADAEFSRN
jgi:hypothetical protein